MYGRVNYYTSIDEFKKIKHSATKTHLVFTTEKSFLDINELNKMNIKLIGGVFPTIIYKNETYSDGFMVFELNDSTDILFIENINDYNIEKENFDGVKSIVTILNGFSKYNSSFLERIFEEVDLDTNIIGGGAGIFSDANREVIFNNSGLYKHAAFLILLDKKIDIGVGHGWDVLEGPFISTKVEGKKLKQIDYKNAIDVYKDTVEKYVKKEITKENFLEVSKDFPLGIVKFNGDSLVRDPIAFTSDGSLILAGDIQPNSIINILVGKKDSLVKDACLAGKSASKSGCEILMMFECVSRLDYLGDVFEEQMGKIVDETSAKHIFGVISIGEIANDGNRYIYFLNKSCVMGGICR